jgi:hypothetical protein
MLAGCLALTMVVVAAGDAAFLSVTPHAAERLEFESITLDQGGPPAKLQLLYSKKAGVARHPVILMLGALKSDAPPPWSVDLLREGFMLAAFTVDHPADPEPTRRPQWLVFDERFAHSYVLGGLRTIKDAGRIIDYLTVRPDVNADKLGWLGSSSTAILGIAAATRDHRLKAFVGFVSTGALREWYSTWEPNGLTKGKALKLWPETEQLLADEPVKHAATLYPAAVLLVNGDDDKVVDVRSTRAFVNAARPYYKADPDRLRLVVYEGMSHNLPADVVKMHAEHWFRLYMHPTQPPPAPPAPIKSLEDSTKRTSINAAEHKDVIGGKGAGTEQKKGPPKP